MHSSSQVECQGKTVHLPIQYQPPRQDSSQMALWDPAGRPYRALTLVFLLARAAYFLLALLTPSPAYDSSTSLILPPRDGQANDGDSVWWRLLTALSERLTRWDAIYFVKIAERGYANEQEWAFGYGMTALMGVAGRS